MEKDLIIKKEDVLRFNLILTKIVDKSRSDCVILINKSGRMLTSQSEGTEYDKTALSALISSTFASTNSIASIIGEKEFTSLVQEGEEQNLYVTLVDEHTILGCIFSKRSNFERVKKYINDFNPYLKDSLKQMYRNTISSPEINLDIGRN